MMHKKYLQVHVLHLYGESDTGGESAGVREGGRNPGPRMTVEVAKQPKEDEENALNLAVNVAEHEDTPVEHTFHVSQAKSRAKIILMQDLRHIQFMQHQLVFSEVSMCACLHVRTCALVNSGLCFPLSRCVPVCSTNLAHLSSAGTKVLTTTCRRKLIFTEKHLFNNSKFLQPAFTSFPLRHLRMGSASSCIQT